MQSKKGISIRRLHFVMALVMLVVSVLLLFTTFRAKLGYSQMRENVVSYILWERDAAKLQLASDYLTEQVRCFVETGKREYLDNYFEEANVTRRREQALESIEQISGDNTAYESLEAAMGESVALMDWEYYAMRMTIAAYGYDIHDFPEVVQRVELTEEEALYPPERMNARARELVFDDAYHLRKKAISENVESCLNTLAQKVDDHQRVATEALDRMMSHERTLIIIAILTTLFTLMLTTFLVISPLLRAVMFIRADQPIPITGSYEFQFLAKTYNLMYEANQEKTEKLTYDATHDSLTGIHNRSGYMFFLKNTDWSTSALLLFDVDKFKDINDHYGHEAGDAAIRRVADVLRSSFRSQDHVCRIGGDEFAVIMVHIGPGQFELVQSKVARINEALDVAENGLPALHVSCGVAFGDHTQDVEKIFRMADAALYQVKAAGGRGCRLGGEANRR